MGKTIAVHSSKGGTGKTVVALNLACAYASRGKDVCLLDVDFKAPTFFSEDFPLPAHYLNDVLAGKCDILDAILDVSDRISVPGKVFVGLSNPDILAIREISRKDRKWQSKALKNLMSSKKTLLSRFDSVIMDVGPGVDFTSVNAIAVSDFVLMVSKPGHTCCKCTRQVVNGVYASLEKPCGMLQNMCHEELLESCNTSLEVLGRISCSCEVAIRNESEIFTVSDPSHPFSKAIFELMHDIDLKLENS